MFFTWKNQYLNKKNMYCKYYFSNLICIISAQGQGQRPWLGMEHPNKTKRTRLNYLEKAIKIYN